MGSLEVIEGDLGIYENNLESLSGADSLSSVTGSLYIRDNSTLTQLQGMSSLEQVIESLLVTENPVLTSLEGFGGNPTSVGGYLIIRDNPMLSCDIADVENQFDVDSAYQVVCHNAPDAGCGPDECPW